MNIQLTVDERTALIAALTKLMTATDTSPNAMQPDPHNTPVGIDDLGPGGKSDLRQHKCNECGFFGLLKKMPTNVVLNNSKKEC
jgi:hypothetical protein